jgi:hypothetical protein
MEKGWTQQGSDADTGRPAEEYKFKRSIYEGKD